MYHDEYVKILVWRGHYSYRETLLPHCVMDTRFNGLESEVKEQQGHLERLTSTSVVHQRILMGSHSQNTFCRESKAMDEDST